MNPTQVRGIVRQELAKSHGERQKAFLVIEQQELERLQEVERLAVCLCRSGSETEQNGWRYKLGHMLCGWNYPSGQEQREENE